MDILDSWREIEARGKIKQAVDGAKSARIKKRKQQQYREKDVEVKRALRRDKRKWMDNIAEEAEKCAALGYSGVSGIKKPFQTIGRKESL
jgi:hypothetical protein